MGDYDISSHKRVAINSLTTLESVNAPDRFNHEQTGDWCFESRLNRRPRAPLDRLVGQSRTMMKLRARIAKYAETDETVLISGETGTGKELIAKVLHDLSSRVGAPFIAINCAAIPGALAESQLFGSVRGAYTGAVQARRGLISLASGGTLFLDEFGELSLDVQSKLLRFLELATYRRVGSDSEERADVRILAATNRNLEKCISCGEFRADLYYRVNVLQIVVPPLRKHPLDIPHIVGEILGELLQPGSAVRIAESVMSELIHAPWLGNVRELRNVLRRSLVMSDGKLIDRLENDEHPVENYPESDPKRRPAIPILLTALTRHKGSLEGVAHELNVSTRTIQRRMKEAGLRLKDFKRV